MSGIFLSVKNKAVDKNNHSVIIPSSIFNFLHEIKWENLSPKEVWKK